MRCIVHRLDDLLASDAIFVTNTVHVPRDVALVDGPPLAAVGVLGQQLIDRCRPTQARRPPAPIAPT